jgi:hypothetical protein
MMPLRNACDRDPNHNVEYRKGCTHETELKAAEAELISEWLDQHIDDDPVDEADRRNACE